MEYVKVVKKTEYGTVNVELTIENWILKTEYGTEKYVQRRKGDIIIERVFNWVTSDIKHRNLKGKYQQVHHKITESDRQVKITGWNWSENNL